jgi:hypothetical protein
VNIVGTRCDAVEVALPRPEDGDDGVVGISEWVYLLMAPSKSSETSVAVDRVSYQD